MKQLLYICSILSLVLTSCYKDNSNKYFENISPIVIDSVKYEHSAFMFEYLTIEPTVYKKGTPDDKLSYEWKVYGNSIVPIIIGTEKNLNAIISVKAEASSYNLQLTVTDETTKIKAFKLFLLKVSNSFSEGLIVADTKDGVNSDLSLIVDRCFNSSVGRNATKIFKDAYSQTNREMIPGLVHDMKTSFRGTNRTLTVLTEKTILRTDYYDFARIPSECDAGIFIIPPKTIDAKFIRYDYLGMYEIMNVNGLIYPRNMQSNNRLYSFTIFPNETPDYEITHLFYSITPHKGYAFDAKNNRILFFTQTKSFAAARQVSPLFDVNNLSDYEPILLGQTNSTDIRMLTRNKKTGKYECLVMLKTKLPNDNSTNFALAIIDYSAATEINSAKYFAFNALENTIYYATDKKLYATSMDNINSVIQYEVKNGEIITGIEVWDDAAGKISHEYINESVPDGYIEISSKNRMMLVTIYNENTKEGKVVAIPIVTLGIGGLEKNPIFHREFGGFNKILKITKQSK